MDYSEEEREMDTSNTPFGEGNSSVHRISDDASFELALSPALLKEHKETVKIMLHEITHTLTSGNITQLAHCRRAANNIFSMNWAQLDIRPLKTIFDELFTYLESLRDLYSLGPTALFRQEDETLAALSTLRGSIERTRSMLADLERQRKLEAALLLFVQQQTKTPAIQQRHLTSGLRQFGCCSSFLAVANEKVLLYFLLANERVVAPLCSPLPGPFDIDLSSFAQSSRAVSSSITSNNTPSKRLSRTMMLSSLASNEDRCE
ncbi:hypothetical protein MRB53_005909 [Persea americana]|uniref:Uncharacterized protein n=1 Tax=Persea americana TaxID=3435 RepID=A0ACC2MEV6_PERAE|nr:hypothetical protein MRB53_005909 [Persea americana]